MDTLRFLAHIPHKAARSHHKSLSDHPDHLARVSVPARKVIVGTRQNAHLSSVAVHANRRTVNEVDTIRHVLTCLVPPDCL